jgi:hypothetical protein
MGKYDLETAYLPDAPSEEAEEIGQSEAETKTESPDETGQETKAEEVKEEETSEQEPKAEPEKEVTKKGFTFSAQFTTLPAAMKAAVNLSEALDTKVDFDKMTLDDVKRWYDDNRPRLGKEGFKGDREKTKKMNEDIKKEENLADLSSKLDKLLESQPVKEEKKKEEVKEPFSTPPIPPEFDEDLYTSLIIDDPPEAAKLMREFRKAERKYNEDRTAYEGAQLGRLLGPKLQQIDKISKAEQEREQERQQSEAKKTSVKEWNEAKKYIQDFVDSEQGEGSFDKFGRSMDEILDENADYYVSYANQHGKKKAMFKLYENATERSIKEDRDKRLRELEEENAQFRNGKTLEQIQVTKEAARISQSNGGMTKKVPSKMTDQEKFENSMRGNPQTRNKYSIDNY